MKTIGYVRACLDKEINKDRIKTFCVDMGWELKSFYTDEDIAMLNKEKISRLLSFCNVHECKILVVNDLDNLAKSVKEFVFFLDCLENSGINFVSITENFNTATDNGKLLLNILKKISLWEDISIIENADEAISSHTPVAERIQMLRQKGLSYSEIADIILNKTNVKTKNVQHYIASLESDTFHYPFCQWVEKISEENRINFQTYQEAISSGRRPCNICKPRV